MGCFRVAVQGMGPRLRAQRCLLGWHCCHGLCRPGHTWVESRPSSPVPLARRRPGQLRGSRATVGHRYRWRDGSWLSVHLWNAPEPGSGTPFSGGRLLMGSHDRAVEHEVGTVAVLRQGFEDPLPYPRLGPTREALVNGLPLAMALRKVLPSGARAKHPQNILDKKPVVSPRLARIAGLAQKQGLNPFPLLVAQLVSFIMPSPTANQLENKDSHNIIRVNHECRLNLDEEVGAANWFRPPASITMGGTTRREGPAP